MRSSAYAVIIILILLAAAGVLGMMALTKQVGFRRLNQGQSNATSTSSSSTGGSCTSSSGITRASLQPVHFDAITKFMLPSPQRSPNAITVANDGSVWFGELSLPGVGHLYTNGTLIEYPWPYNYSSAPTCTYRSDIWGIALWSGMVWASDPAKSQFVGLNPSSDTFERIPLASGSFPYTLAVGPDGNLWFTQLSSPAQIGKIDPHSHQIQYFSLPSGANASSAYLAFYNDSIAYALTINPINGTGKVFHFNPLSSLPRFTEIGGTSTLYSPTSIALGEGGIWVTEHSASDMAFYSPSSKEWELYPTSRVNYTLTSLTYFDVSNGSTVWFNEHYGNKLGVICCNRTQLTEYSFSDPPVRNGSLIDNALTIARGTDRVWFTEWTANYVGFVNTSYSPPFSVSANKRTLQLRPGEDATITLNVTGNYSQPLSLQFSDSERSSSVPRDITVTASATSMPFLHSEKSLTLTVGAGRSVTPGSYRLLITVNGGLILQSLYIAVHVST